MAEKKLKILLHFYASRGFQSAIKWRMARYPAFALRIAGFLVATQLVCLAQTEATPLHSGDLFPRLSGQCLSNKSLELPTAAAGKPAVVIFSFSKAAGDDSRLWNEHLAKDFSNSVPAYSIIVLGSVPRLLRGMIVSDIKKGMPASRQDQNIVLYQDEKIWKLRLAVSDDHRAYVLLITPDSRIRWSSPSAFNDAEYARLKDQIESLPKAHPEQ